MTTLLQDYFDGPDGLMNGRAPTINEGHTWSTQAFPQQGGVFISDGSITADGYYSEAQRTDLGSLSYAFTQTPADGAEITFSGWVYLTPGGATSFTALQMELRVNGVVFKCRLRYDAGLGEWLAEAYDNYGPGTPVAVAIGPDEEIQGVFSIASGTQSFTVNGATSSNYNGYADSSGVSGSLGVLIGGFTYIDYISVESLVIAPTVISVTAPMATVCATASFTPNVINASAPSPTVQSSATTHTVAHLELCAPMPSIASYSGSVAMVFPPGPTVRVYTGASSKIAAPSPLVTSRAHDSTGDNAAHVAAPSPTLSFYTGAAAKAKAPSPALSATGTVTGSAKATLSVPSPTLSATGKVSGMATTTLTAPSPNLIGYGGAVCSVSITGSPTVSATGTTGSIGGAQITCPLFELTATATVQNYGSANLIAPSPELGRTIQAWLTAPSATLTAIGTAVVTATYEAYAVNLNHTPVRGVEPVDEVTRYTNFPFTHVVRYKNSYYGANSTGLYLLEGTTDNGTPIPWAFETAITDFKSPNKKTLAAAYFSGRFGPASTIRLIEGEKMPNTYSFTTPRGTLAQNHRQKFGKGTKGRYYAISASGTGACELDGIEPEVHQLTRRI